MQGTLSLIPPNNNMVETDYVDSSPTLEEIEEMVGTTFLSVLSRLSTFEKDGAIVPSKAVIYAIEQAEGVEGLEVNESAMRLLKTAILRENGELDEGDQKTILYGNLVIATGDQEFLDAVLALFPEGEGVPEPDMFMTYKPHDMQGKSAQSRVGVPVQGMPDKMPNALGFSGSAGSSGIVGEPIQGMPKEMPKGGGMLKEPPKKP